MRDSDWSRQILLRSDWLGPSVAPITTVRHLKVKGVMNMSEKVGRLGLEL